MTRFLARSMPTLMICMLLTPAIARAQSVAQASAQFQSQVMGEPAAPVETDGFEKWQWLRSTCADCEIVLVGKNPELDSPKVQAFMRTLASRKAELIRLYGVHGAEYNLLAQMAVGILGRESKFFESARYQLKEDFPWAVHVAKVMRSAVTGEKVDVNSRGPTQIKVIPAKIVAHYGFTPDDLEEPENAAIATMGYLIEALGELKNRVAINRLQFVTPATYADYLPYIYFGASKALVSGKAKPESNAYVQSMKGYMQWVDVYERPPR